MSDFKIGKTTIVLNTLPEHAKSKATVVGRESELSAYRSHFHEMVNHIKTLADSPYCQNRVEQLKQDIAENKYKIDYKELIEQLLVEEV